VPAAASVYYADIDWAPSQLFEQGERLEPARMPDDDYWVRRRRHDHGGGHPALCASCLPGLTQTNETWIGATLVFWKHDMGIHSTAR